MRAVIQRVQSAACRVDDKITGQIQRGFLLFLGVAEEDEAEDLDWLVRKVPQIRVFEDDEHKMNQSLLDIDGEVIVISQFTLFGNLRKGTRPSFNRAAPPEKATSLYEEFVRRLSIEIGKPVPTGIFAAHMQIEAHNDGPVTLIIDTRDKRF